MTDSVVIAHRFRGPAESGNGGYTCGLLAAGLVGDGAAEVTLRAPPPLDRPLEVEPDGDAIRLKEGEVVIAEAASAAPPRPDLPASVSLDDARRARESSPLHDAHPFPECFVCGPKRRRGDGLCITCGPVEGRNLVAAPFEADETIADPDGRVGDEFVWAALDCPSGIAAMWLVEDVGVAVLGRLRATLISPLEAGRDYVAVGWPISREGRKLRSGTAIFDLEGEALAVSEATWIELREQPAT